MYNELAALCGKDLAQLLADLPIKVRLGELGFDDAMELRSRYLTSGPYVKPVPAVGDPTPPHWEPEAVPRALADPDHQAWHRFSTSKEAQQQVRSLTYLALTKARSEAVPPKSQGFGFCQWPGCDVYLRTGKGRFPNYCDEHRAKQPKPKLEKKPEPRVEIKTEPGGVKMSPLVREQIDKAKAEAGPSEPRPEPHRFGEGAVSLSDVLGDDGTEHEPKSGIEKYLEWLHAPYKKEEEDR